MLLLVVLNRFRLAQAMVCVNIGSFFWSFLKCRFSWQYIQLGNLQLNMLYKGKEVLFCTLQYGRGDENSCTDAHL